MKAGEFSFVLKDAKGKEIETVQNDKDGNVKFKAIEYKKRPRRYLQVHN